MGNILIADDNASLRDGVRLSLEAMGHSVVEAMDGEQAINAIESRDFDLVMTDLKMPKVNGIEVLTEIKKRKQDTAVLIITAFGTVENAVEAMKLGASDFICKPFKAVEIEAKVSKVLEGKKLKEQVERLSNENRYLREEIKVQYGFGDLVGESKKMQEVYDLVHRVSESNSTILIRGESGTGKELIARAIHHYSRRKDCPFVKVSCVVFAEGVLESELFGHEKGAFTGAQYQNIGRFELANEGTIFLDEIGDISLSTQVKLLRVLQEKEFERVGGNKTIKVDVRLLAATNQKIENLISEKKFREDLFYRLNVVPVFVPPLRERKEDIPLLVNHFLEKYCAEMKKVISDVDPQVMRLLVDYDWKGNVRELENVIERAVVLGTGNILTDKFLPAEVKKFEADTKMPLDFPDRLSGSGLDLQQIMERVERELIMKAYRESGGVKAKAAELLGIKRGIFRYKFDKYK